MTGPWPRLLRTPTEFFAERLASPHPPLGLFVTLVAPLANLRAVAVLVQSAMADTPVAGVILAIGSFGLQVGTWLGVSLVMPTLARQFLTTITDRQAFAMVSYAMVPVWCAGVLYVFPDDAGLWFWWSRILVLLAAVWSAALLQRALVALGVSPESRWPVLAATLLAGFVVYSVLFVALGISSHIALFLLGTSR